LERAARSGERARGIFFGAAHDVFRDAAVRTRTIPLERGLATRRAATSANKFVAKDVERSLRCFVARGPDCLTARAPA